MEVNYYHNFDLTPHITCGMIIAVSFCKYMYVIIIVNVFFITTIYSLQDSVIFYILHEITGDIFKSGNFQ